MAVGSISRGTRRKALFATELNIAFRSPPRTCRIGLRAQTYPVTKAKIATPIRPCVNTRRNGYWKSFGGSPGSEVGFIRSRKNPRVICVAMTRTEARPRRPYGDVSLQLRRELPFQHKSPGEKLICTYIDPFDVLRPTHPASSMRGRLHSSIRPKIATTCQITWVGEYK